DREGGEGREHGDLAGGGGGAVLDGPGKLDGLGQSQVHLPISGEKGAAQRGAHGFFSVLCGHIVHSVIPKCVQAVFYSEEASKSMMECRSEKIFPTRLFNAPKGRG